MKSKMKKILAVLLMVCLVVPSVPSRVAEATDKSIDEFASVTGSTSAVNVGNYAYNGSKVNTTMSNGAVFVLHTKVKATLSGNTKISYTGYGSGYWEKFHSEFRKDDTGWFFQLESENQYQKWYTEITPQYLSESQCNEIKGKGLDLYLVKTGTANYAIYMENADLTDVILVGEWTSRAASPQIYEVKNNTVDSVTNGYFYQGYTAEGVVKALYEPKAVDKTNISEHVTTQGLEDSYRMGDMITFTAEANGEYAIQDVKINDKVLNEKEDGTYEYVVTVADVDGLVVEILASKKSIAEFASVTGSTTAENVGNNAYNGSKDNTTMTKGAVIV